MSELSEKSKSRVKDVLNRILPDAKAEDVEALIDSIVLAACLEMSETIRGAWNKEKVIRL